jgi:hypothetical protein
VLFALVANRAPSSKPAVAKCVSCDTAVPGLEAMDKDQAMQAVDLLVEADTPSSGAGVRVLRRRTARLPNCAWVEQTDIPTTIGRATAHDASRPGSASVGAMFLHGGQVQEHGPLAVVTRSRLLPGDLEIDRGCAAAYRS